MSEAHETFGPSRERRCSKCGATALPDQCARWMRIGRSAIGIERFLCEICGQMFSILFDAYEYGELDVGTQDRIFLLGRAVRAEQLESYLCALAFEMGMYEMWAPRLREALGIDELEMFVVEETSVSVEQWGEAVELCAVCGGNRDTCGHFVGGGAG